MGEAIDYNALSWVRQELAETLKQARHHLEEYAANKNKEALQGCAAHLHEARGPLKMVSLKGADLLTGEMEEIIADLLMGSVDQPDTALELLMQGFLELPEYLYSLRPGRPDNPTVLVPLVNSLRANRGEQPLEEEAVFSPDLSVRVPGAVFDVNAEHPEQDITAMARAARVRFQTGLLDWYRNGDQGQGLQTLAEVLDELTQKAGSEPVARLWWVSAGLAELLHSNAMQVTPAIKRLFGQIDRHIKRLMDQGEAVFDDVLTDDLLKNLLFHINSAESDSTRIAEIKSTYRLGGGSGADDRVGAAACSEELLQTVSGTVREDIVRVKEQLDEFLKGDQSDVTVLNTVADDLHALANMLGMIGMDRLAATVSDRELLLRDCASNARSLSDEESAATANMLIAIEDALSDITATLDSDRSGESQDDATFRQGQEAVVEAVMDDMSSAKESINEFLRSCGDFDLLIDVPVILNRIHGGLKLVGQERLATVTTMVKTFISRELVAGHRELSEEDLDTLADAICSVEYCVEELVANRDFGQRAINIAEESVEKLGYACPQAGEIVAAEDDEVELSGVQPAAEQPQPAGNTESPDTPSAQTAVDGGDDSITSLQVVDPDGDPEIIEIFIEEAAEELEKISALIPAWCDDPVNADSLTEIRRSLHTMKGSGRMVGAMATGEFSWAMENLVNKVLDGTVDVSAPVIELMRQVPDALAALLEQVKNPELSVSAAINTLASEAHDSTRPGAGAPVPAAASIEETPPAEVDSVEPAKAAEAAVTEESIDQLPQIEQVPAPVAADFPVLSDDADEEIVDIFMEEAAEEFGTISVTVPAWVAQPENNDMVMELQRSFHTLKGSGRMAGAMRIGEFCWIVELMFTRLTDGVIEPSAGLFTFMVRMPGTLRQMLDQIRDGSEPEIDVQAMFNEATTLANGGLLAVAEESGQSEESVVDIELHDDDVQTVEQTSPTDTGSPETAGSAMDESPAGQSPVEQVTAPVAADFPVLSDDADEEIVDIFMEEAAEEFGTISSAVPAWVAQPENSDRVAELQRSFHTLKGSGRMAGAMRIGEFCWIVELMFTRLTDGVIEPSAGLFTFMVRVPDTLRQMLDQIRDGSEPEIDVQAMFNEATTLANGGLPAAPQDDVPDYELQDDGEQLAEDEEPTLLEIFSKEANEHVRSLQVWLDAYEEPGRVTDELYRSLHTLSGISESADMPVIGRLADGLYGWFGALYEEKLPVRAVGYDVLRDCTSEIGRILETLPEVESDEDVLDVLCTRISALPSMEQVAEAAATLPVEPSREEVAEPPVSGEEGLATSLEAPESSLQALTGEEPVAELPEEQSEAEQAPAGTGMLSTDVTAGEEPPVETVADGIDTEDEAVMEVAETAEELPVVEEADFTAVVDEPVEQTPASQSDDPYEEMDQELYEIFVEEATEVMDASEAVLKSWSDEPDNRELMAEFQRHLHTLKGSARMVDLEAIGNLSHAVESVMTELADDKMQVSPDLFGLLADAHDRLADMLDQVRNRQHITAAPDIEAALHTVVESGDVPAIASSAQAEPVPVTEAEPVTGAEPFVEAEAVSVDGSSAEAEPEAEDEPVAAAEPEEASWPLVDEETRREDEPAPPESGEAASGADADDDVADSRAADTEPEAPARPDRRRASPPRLVIDRDKQSNTRGDQVKVTSDVLDNMVNHAGEINIYRSRMEQQISDYRFNLSELDQTISRLRDQLRQLEMETEAQILYRYEQEAEQRNQDFDPLEMDRYSTLQQLSRSLIESISDLRSLQELMENTTRGSETLLLQQSRVSTELQENLIRTRMIPFVSLSPRLRRIARQSARQLDKKVEVELVGEDGEMDRAVVERIIAPLEHMLRNSVAHGIELPRVRKAAGKPVTGRISIEFERDGSEIVLQISDDGAGMDVEAIRERAIERGLMTEESNLPDEDVIQFVLQTGFSTASEVTQISGRGVGMDVVNSEVKQLGGSLHIESEQGKGATLTVRLPYTLAINQGMLVTAGDETFCVPLASVEGVVRFYPEELRECYGDGQQLFEYGGNEYRLKHLGSLLETGAVSYSDERDQVPVLLVRAGEKRIGFHVEALQGIREVVIKPVGPQLSTVDGISGATILGDGRVVMILDMVAVSRREASAQTSTSHSRHDQTGGNLVVMVVDDSITVRKVTTRLLERNGYKVVTAKDGVDAMGKLQESAPDIMLLDIEMPRMDGFELATHMRNDDAFKHLPIIMITSRTGDKHRERAREIGVQHYLGKPYQESDLLDSIHGIIGVSHVAAG